LFWFFVFVFFFFLTALLSYLSGKTNNPFGVTKQGIADYIILDFRSLFLFTSFHLAPSGRFFNMLAFSILPIFLRIWFQFCD